MQLAVEVILSHSVMLVLIPVGVFVGISRVEVLESEMKGGSRSDYY